MKQVEVSPQKHEVAVVGSGPGGSLAACLMAGSGRDVLILEEGSLYRSGEPSAFSRQEMERKYRNGGLTFALGRPRVQYVEARCAGGGSEVNSGLYHRLPEAVRNTWNSRFRVEDFDAGTLSACAAANEQELCVQLMPGKLPKASRLLAGGAEELGWRCQEVPRWQRYDIDLPGGERQTMTRTFLPRAQSAGARLLTGTRVDTIRRRKNYWRIEAETGGGKRAVFHVAHLFLACGAIQTPSLMRRNRLGKGAGKHLHMHPSIKVVALFPEPVTDAAVGVPVHQVKEFSPEMSFGCSISNAHYLTVSMLPHKNGLELVRDRMPYLATFYAMIVPEGRGTVTVLPGLKDPVVAFSLSYTDCALLALALKRLCLLLFRAGAEAVYTPLAGLGALTDAKHLDMLPHTLAGTNTSLMTIHLAATCAMSADPKLGVTDSWGAVHGEHNLHVADAGLLCGAPGVNPQGPLMAVVRRNINHWLELQT
jgi:choline dehydrogenase-like flavoprotein